MGGQVEPVRRDSVSERTGQPHAHEAAVRDLFHRVGDHYAERMTFEAEMIVPRRAIDDLGQEAEARLPSLGLIRDRSADAGDGLSIAWPN